MRLAIPGLSEGGDKVLRKAHCFDLDTEAPIPPGKRLYVADGARGNVKKFQAADGTWTFVYEGTLA
jgi:hypothetical protein